MKTYAYTITVLVILIATSCCTPQSSSKAPNKVSTVDQQQLTQSGGMSARTGESVWQSFTPSISGLLVGIEMGFFHEIDGDGTVRIYSGEGIMGTLLQTIRVRVTSSSDKSISWNYFDTNFIVNKGNMYTFEFIPNGNTIPDPYGICIGSAETYSHGTFGTFSSSAYSRDRLNTSGIIYQQSSDFQMVFRTHIIQDATNTMVEKRVDRHIPQHEVPQMAEGQSRKTEVIQLAIKTIINATEFGFGRKRGVIERRKTDVAFEELMKMADAKEHFSNIFKKGNTYSKLYSLCAIYHLDKELFRKLSSGMDETEKVRVNDGCCVDELNVEAVTSNIRKGQYDHIIKEICQ